MEKLHLLHLVSEGGKVDNIDHFVANVGRANPESGGVSERWQKVFLGASAWILTR